MSVTGDHSWRLCPCRTATMIQPLASLSLNERVKKTLTHQVTMIIIPFYFIFIPECNGGTEFGDLSCRQREREREGQRSEGERGGARSTGDRWRVVVGMEEICACLAVSISISR
jgi:hypothetical protein